MIVYFTGTGNSGYVAEMLADLLDDSIVSANEFTKNDKMGEFSSTKPFVFVSPVYVSALPLVFMEFVERSTFIGNRKAYFVQTCAGGMGACPAYAEKLCRNKALNYMGTAQVIMPQNYLVYFKMHKKDEVERIISEAEIRVKYLAGLISAEVSFPPHGMKKYEYIATEMVIGMYYRFFISAKRFRLSGKCVGCGKCERACPLNNIKLHSGKPVWADRCTHCMACINVCPMKAIDYGHRTKSKPRYYCRKYVPKAREQSGND